jgi:hypothetical protein
MNEFSQEEPPDDASERIRLCLRIGEAFEGVLLGDGVGLYQAQGIDDNECEEVRQSYRLRDEKHDWHRITSENLNKCYSSLSFIQDQPGYWLDVHKIDHALEIFWDIDEAKK